MRTPLQPGRPIDIRRISNWIKRFEGYREQVSEERIVWWLRQFKTNDRDLAARVLDCVEFINYSQMSAAFRQILAGLEGWSIDQSRRRGQWRFVSFSASPGESGDAMINHFRVANKLGHPRFNQLFSYMRDLPSARLTANDTVVFVDDFAGTGRQACRMWTEKVQELLPGEPSTYLVLVAASAVARDKIRNETGMTVVPYHTVRGSHNIFAAECAHFPASEKATLLSYCRRADPNQPRGFGDCGFVVVLANNCPNNSIPILHVPDNGRWVGLFPRQG